MGEDHDETAALFRAGEFVLASGRTATWKIDCDALTPADWEGLALMLYPRVLPFGQVFGVPRGGPPFADALYEHRSPGCDRILVVDDVWTTGGSMERYVSSLRTEKPVQRAVVFARKPPPPTVVALFTMAEANPRDTEAPGHPGSRGGAE